MPNFTLTQVVSNSDGLIGEPQNYSGGLGLPLDETVPNSATTQLNIAIDISAVKAFCIVSSVDVTIKTNSASVPDDTLALLASKPYVWTIDSYDTFKLTADVTSIHVVVAGTEDARIQVKGVVDPTP